MPVYKKLHIDFQLLGYFLNVLHIEFYRRVPKIVFPFLKFQSYKQDKCPKGPLTCILYSEQYFFMPVIFRWRANTGTFFCTVHTYYTLGFSRIQKSQKHYTNNQFPLYYFFISTSIHSWSTGFLSSSFLPIYIMYCTEQIHRVLTYFVNS